MKVKWEDIWCISECPELSELSLDGNPMCSTINYRQTMIASGSKLKILDGRRISVRSGRGDESSMPSTFDRKILLLIRIEKNKSGYLGGRTKKRQSSLEKRN